jgi:hypothetical protein
MKYEVFKSESLAWSFLEKAKWTKKGENTVFSPRPYGECSWDERNAVIYLIDVHKYNYGGRA